MSTAPRHFLDLSELPTKELRTMLDAGAAMKSKLKAQENINAATAKGKNQAWPAGNLPLRRRLS